MRITKISYIFAPRNQIVISLTVCCGSVRTTGCGAVRLAHLLWEQGVTGSNPVIPTKQGRNQGAEKEKGQREKGESE